MTKSFQILEMASQCYDVIIGRDLMRELGLDVIASQSTIIWEDATIPWRDIDSKTTDVFFYDGDKMKPQEKELKKLNNILDAKYQKADLDEEVDKMTTSIQWWEEKTLEVAQKA